MQILIFTSLLSFLALVAMTGNKLWHIKTGKIEEPYDLHLVGPIAKAAHVHGLKLFAQLQTKLEPTLKQAYKDVMLVAYTTSAAIAKRFAKIANAIKGRGELPENRSGASFMLAYAQKENALEE
ncbi:MAG: hypothetical protein WC764_01350 [Candidatus Paceibacterota bacterium]|jgi:hypothetical protein